MIIKNNTLGTYNKFHSKNEIKHMLNNIKPLPTTPHQHHNTNISATLPQDELKSLQNWYNSTLHSKDDLLTGKVANESNKALLNNYISANRSSIISIGDNGTLTIQRNHGSIVPFNSPTSTRTLEVDVQTLQNWYELVSTVGSGALFSQEFRNGISTAIERLAHGYEINSEDKRHIMTIVERMTRTKQEEYLHRNIASVSIDNILLSDGTIGTIHISGPWALNHWLEISARLEFDIPSEMIRDVKDIINIMENGYFDIDENGNFVGISDEDKEILRRFLELFDFKAWKDLYNKAENDPKVIKHLQRLKQNSKEYINNDLLIKQISNDEKISLITENMLQATGSNDED